MAWNYTEQELNDAVIIKLAREIVEKQLGRTPLSLSSVGDAVYWYLAHGDFQGTQTALNELDKEFTKAANEPFVA